MKRRLLDLFCCAGGAARGYQLAGFHVTGVDFRPQPNYCGDDFHEADAIHFLIEHGHEYDAIHASCPCQDNIRITAGNRGRKGWSDWHVNLIPPTRAALAYVRARTGAPTVIENGETDCLRPDLVLCGLSFGLRVYRHRYFELDGFAALAPGHPSHRGHRVAGWRHGVRYEGDMFAVYGDGGGKGTVAEWQAAMGIDWTDVRAELVEAIPPAYTEFIGSQIMAHLEAVAA